MSWFASLLIAFAVIFLLWVISVVVLLIGGRGEPARALAGCLVLVARLVRHSPVPRRRKLLLGALAGYLALPFDLVPDFIPVAGQLDDAIVAALVVGSGLRGGGEALLREHWPGPEKSLRLVPRALAKYLGADAQDDDAAQWAGWLGTPIWTRSLVSWSTCSVV